MISDDHVSPVFMENGQKQVVYASISSSSVEWLHLNLLSRAIRLVPVFPSHPMDPSPLILITACKYPSHPLYFDAQPYTVDSFKAGLVSMYENELIVTFRTFENGVFFFSVADQGDMLIAQIVSGTVETIFDFGSLSRTSITGGRALNDGEWHEMRWSHQFDSVQLYVDGILMNATTPSGLYRKLDFNFQIEIGGRPQDQYSADIETSFHGCLARIQLNNIDLLSFAPATLRECQMPKPQILTIHSGSVVIPYSFLPFAFEFRVLPAASVLLAVFDANNATLVSVAIDANETLLLEADQQRIRQASSPLIQVTDGGWHALSMKLRGGRLDIDVDGMTVLWLEGAVVRKIGLRMSSFRLAAQGCYRSATVDLKSAAIIAGKISKGKCSYIDHCMPNPCENGGKCVQTELDHSKCECTEHYGGRYCHTSLLPRSCEDYRTAIRAEPKVHHPLLNLKHYKKVSPSPNVTIDLDGGGPLKPFTVRCTTAIGNLKDGKKSSNLDDQDDWTILEYYSTTSSGDLFKDPEVIVAGETEPGAVRKELNYLISDSELDRFVEGFESCRQHMRFECQGGAKLMTYNNERRPSTWYATRNGQHGLQWADAPPYSRMCSCAMNSSCVHHSLCNCDSGRDGVDEGYNTHSQLLPIMQLFVGGTGPKTTAKVNIGPLQCARRYVHETITFVDRNQHLVGSQSFHGNVFDIYFQVKFSHTQMTIWTWESANSERWFQLFVRGGKVVGQLVNAGRTHEITSDNAINDDEWHSVYWEVDPYSMKIVVDGKEKTLSAFYLLPTTYTYIVGSRTSRGNAGYAGQIRGFYLCGREIELGQMVRKQNPLGIQLGATGYCQINRCSNNGDCVEFYDTYKCNCSRTPFGGDKCDQEVGMWVPVGSRMYIPWQHPGQISTCYRMNVHTLTSNVSLIRAKAHFAESSFNLSIDPLGHLNVLIYDGVFFHHNETYTKQIVHDDKAKDIEFCATKKAFSLKLNNEDAIKIDGNFSFFINFNSWSFIDKTFTGCISRLQVGSTFPLKDPTDSRLNYKGKIRFGSCPYDHLQYNQPPETADIASDIQISSFVKTQQNLLYITPVLGVLAAFILALMICICVCYLRSRPDGVYKTNENVVAYCSPSKSAEPLVEPAVNKEYFC
uniref:Neurexin-1a n=1 Tax=Panagrellus redivivus TaxID=6233 RepID=A0A7E4UYU3_PANRE